MLATSKEATGTGGRGLNATASLVGSKTNGWRITICAQQQRQASPESVLWPPGMPETSQVEGEKTSQAINSIPASRRMITAAIRKIVSREGITAPQLSHMYGSDLSASDSVLTVGLSTPAPGLDEPPCSVRRIKPTT